MKTIESLSVNFSAVERCYPGCKILNIDEMYYPGRGFSIYYPDGRTCLQNDISLEEAVHLANDAGVTSVQLKLVSRRNQLIYADFQINELNRNSL